MALNIGKEITALKRMTVPELRRKYAQVFGEDTTSRHKEFLIRRIVWRLQVNQEGGLSERARQRARELAAESDVRLTAPRPRPVAPGGETTTAPIEFPQDDRLPMPGAIITRRYKGRDRRGAGPAAGLRVRGRGLPDPERRGQEGHRHPLERLSLLQAWARRECADGR